MVMLMVLPEKVIGPCDSCEQDTPVGMVVGVSDGVSVAVGAAAPPVHG